MQLRQLEEQEKQTILDNYEEISDWKEVGPFCVDGRDGNVEMSDGSTPTDHLFVQALGGSLLIAVISYILQGKNYSNVLEMSLKTLQDNDFGCGVHRGSHAGGDSSDCGFADNLQKIISRLADESDTIAGLIDQAAPGARDKEIWTEVIERASSSATIELPTGENMISSCNSSGSNLQTLDGDHAEVAAVVNLASGSTLNTGKLVSGGLQAFNLDLWYVLEQARVLGLDENHTAHLALGLYVATEMVLVEDKKQIRLPILINK